MIKPKMLLLLSAFALTQSFAHAKNLYTYQDSDGSLIVTDKKQANSNLKQIGRTSFADSNIHSYSNWGGSNKYNVTHYSKNAALYESTINDAAITHGVDAKLIRAVIHTESAFNPNARSPVGAVGLMQLMPATARRFNVSDSYNPTQNIYGGAKYLAWLLKRFNGNTRLAIAAYNAGEGNVTKYGGIPPFRETQDYVQRVLSRYNTTESIQRSSSTGVRIMNVNYSTSSTSPTQKIIKISSNAFGDDLAQTY